MAITVLKTRKGIGTDDSIVQFQCDDESDVAALPTNHRSNGKVCAAGSRAFVLNPDDDKSPVRVLTEAGVWVESPESIVIDCGSPEDRT